MTCERVSFLWMHGLCRLATAILAPRQPLWQVPPAPGPLAFLNGADICCRSSVVEHSLGKGEVDSSILSGSTRFNQ
jgi:hypothetical protein